MMLRSMTGFGRCLVENTAFVQQWEIRSVNGKYLDIKWRLPLMLRYLEPNLDKVARGFAIRGRIEICLQLQFAPGHAPRPRFDAVQAAAMLDSLAKLAAERGDVPRFSYTDFLLAPALWAEPELEQDDGIGKQLEDGLALALEDWNESRASEGAALAMDLQSRILRLEEWTELIGTRAPEIKEERAEMLRERLGDFCAAKDCGLEDSRFLQEIVILADRLDVSEELTRLSAHLERLQQLLQDGGDSGRRLDFTLQECFREINTCGNKISDAQIARVIVDFKNELEKCREQVQNLE